jgi:flagellar biosynthetic protein FlhB
MAGSEDQDDKTEQPTQRKLDQALEKGDVVKSQEVGHWFILAALTLAAAFAAAPAARDLTHRMALMVGNAHQIGIDPAGLSGFGWTVVGAVLLALAVPFLLVILAGLAGNMIQHRFVWTLEMMKPKAERVSPVAGLKRMFGKEALVLFVKGLVKIAAVGAIIATVLWPYAGRFESMASEPVAGILPAALTMTLKMLGAVLATVFVIAGADYLYQRFRYIERQKMSHHELKQEFKETEGNPEIKAKVRQIRQAQARKRMMADVPKASVVIMNPTHYAVALKYETGMAAPVCVAKGIDELALRIRDVARESEVPVVENPPLARALHASVEIDGEVPVEHYKAVAQVIGYVLGLRRRRV